MICNKCGNEYPDNVPYCPYCTNNAQQQAPVQYAQQPVQYAQPAPVATMPPKKKSKLPIIIVAVLLVAAIVAGVIFLPGMLKKDGEDAKGEGQETPKEPVEISCITAIDFETSMMMNMEMSMEIGYDENGYPARVYIVSDGEAAESRAVYNEENHTYTTETYERGILTETAVSECDEEWRDLKTTTYVDGVEKSYTIYEYNDAKELSKETLYEGGAEKQSTVYEYDANNNLTKEAIFKNGIEVDTITITYDADGKTTKKTHRYEDGIYTEHVYTYGENGLCDKVVYYEDGSEAGYDVFTYNENGQVASRETYMMGMKIITANVTYTTVKVKAEHADALAEKQTELLQEIVFFS